MSEDAELLHRYATDHSEAAFAELIQRHVDLVYSAALRLGNGDVHRAQDVTQQVLSELARQAKRLTKHPALAGWLYTTTRRVALHSLRTEQRRKAREQETTAMNELFRETAPEPDWEHLCPVLEDAMHELGEKDRRVVLLRFFQNKSLNGVGLVLGLNENAARMRVERALDKLRVQLARKGVTSTTVALALMLKGNAVVAAPPAFVATLTSASLTAATVGGTTLTLLKLMTMTKLKLAVVSAIVVASVVTPLVIQHQAQAKLRGQDESLQQRANRLAKLQAENERLANKPVEAKSPQSLPEDQFRELLRLRGEVGRLRRDVLELSQPDANAPLSRDDVLASIAKQYADRVSQLKQSLEANSSEKIPELQRLTDSEWLQLSSTPEFDPENGYRRAMSKARGWAENGFVNDQLNPALQGYAKANNGQFPSDLFQLKPYFKSVVDDAILQRWEIVPANELVRYITAQALGAGDDHLIAPKAPVNLALDMPTVCSLSKVTAFASRPTNQWIRAR